MELLDQKTKKIMEGCKVRARDAGLQFDNETLEYIVTNRDLLELTPKYMIPTLYDYWVHDVELLKEKGKYELYPSNPYETVINTRPAISFYNDNNPDWLNVMIFYHVLAHIDFFQNNAYFRLTWDYDFTGQALSDKRSIAKFRSENGRWVDYIIEFARGIDNLVGYYSELDRADTKPLSSTTDAINFYFDIYLQSIKKIPITAFLKEIELYNLLGKTLDGEQRDRTFLADIKKKDPEFDTALERSLSNNKRHNLDLLQYIVENSEFLKKTRNTWMKSIIEVVRKTSLFFQPQIRTKILNEGWASYWHEKLFLTDDRITGHEVDFARINALITSLPRIGLNPYALGMRLFDHIEKQANEGKNSMHYQLLKDEKLRESFNEHNNKGMETIFDVRKNMSDYLFIDTFIDQDFVNKHDLFVAGKRLVPERMVYEYYIKSKNANDYKQMISGSLYHPPCITVSPDHGADNTLYLIHRFEEKPLINEYLSNTLLGIEYLWGGPVMIETSEAVPVRSPSKRDGNHEQNDSSAITWKRVVYTMKNRKMTKKEL